MKYSVLIIGENHEDLAERFSGALEGGYATQDIDIEIEDNQIMSKYIFTKEEFVDNYYPSLNEVYTIINYENMITTKMLENALNLDKDDDNKIKIMRCFENIINRLDDDEILSFYVFSV